MDSRRPDITPDDAVAEIVAAALRAEVPDDVQQRHLAVLDAALRQAATDPVTEAGHARVVDLRSRRRARRITILALAAAMVLSSGAVAVAADDAVPGDPLHGVDRAVENVRLAVTRSPEARARFLVSLTEERLGEIGVLRERGREDRIPQTARDAADTANAALTEAARAGNAQARTLVAQKVARSVVRLQAVHDRLQADGHASPAALAALERAIGKGRRASAPHADGQGATPPGRSGTAPGQQNTPPGQQDTPPGQQDKADDSQTLEGEGGPGSPAGQGHGRPAEGSPPADRGRAGDAGSKQTPDPSATDEASQGRPGQTPPGGHPGQTGNNP